ncbi:hypothetical protein GWI33_006801 [Rhynchophorus ferrugineus]|uniref:Exonuclease 1 n=1 Tax=Rhynchophorus ferrugineus TaxID=354439 RepID=A0A834MF67_RHYFE|nr:hypothetical protein GWI33_006801 [Rhynchophorus ferrugineus]
MGITGLLPFLEKATRNCHVSEFRGGTVAVDSYCLLHRGATICVEQLARGEDTQLYVNYCMKYVKMLLSYDIHPIMVFDGRNLKAKAATEAKRRESRKKAKQKAAELLVLGKNREAQTYLRQCVDITPKMAHNLIKECRKLNVDCIVAPYESDAQMAFFSQKGIAECVITEDSDLLVFGCKKVLFKMDVYGAGRLIESDKIQLAMNIRTDQYTFEKFRFMCILSGCDYVDSLNGVGLKKAEKFLKITAEAKPEMFLSKIPRYLNMRQLVVTDEYKNKFLEANATFLHQVIFDPYKRKLVHLQDPEELGTDPRYLLSAGEKFSDEKAYQVALGNLDPYNFEEYDNWEPENLPHYSIWSGIYKKRVSRKQEKHLQKQHFQNYFSTASQSKDTDEVDETIIEEDNEIKKELSIYTTKLEIIESPIKEDIKDEEECKEQETSPILKANPFVKRRKLSKFKETYLGNTVVRSRFFGQSQDEPKGIDDFIMVPLKKASSQTGNSNTSQDRRESQTNSKKRMVEEETTEIDIKYTEVINETTQDCVQTSPELIKTKVQIKKDKSSVISKTTNKQVTLHNFFAKYKKVH